ncbi:dihydroneopterin aldolase [Shimia gijangensis]|uniref:dihydroneopterin aldolase n=1 Tax=Shimia gijangensis TaxID=1470563 RepID=A0A1M6D4X9_9RHOB|nr:dihydroneopterin aldolase [Shimia gijangensis]SHI68280.1 dihydroneopterin aldolase [Shimia gijangensis]
MSDETRLAFAHPEERSMAMASNEGLDRISVRDHIEDVEIGAFQAERGVTQRLRFNVVVEVRSTMGNVGDDVDLILSYDKVTEAITGELAEERFNLLETLAERVAERILLEPPAMRVFVRIEKLDRGTSDLGVEIVRTRAAKQPVGKSEQGHPHPCVVFLSNEALKSSHLTGWIDQLAAAGEPLLICVGMHEIAGPEIDDTQAQLRIDLLSIEQNAWSLAARDPRCVVVETRTELDWAMKNDQISVWAPSKIVLDAVGAPAGNPRKAAELARWFATEMEAFRFVSIGDSLPECPGLTTQNVSIETVIL